MASRNHAVPRRIRSLIFSVLAASSLAGMSAQAATLTLNNGDKLSGELKQLSDDTLIFVSGVFGEVKIPWKDVRQLDSDDGVRVQLSDGSQLKGRMTLEAGGSVAVESGTGSAVPDKLTRADVTALNPPIVDNARKYSGRADVGGTINRGNSTDEQLHINAELIGKTPGDRYTVELEVNEGKSANIETVSNSRLLGKYDYFLSAKNYAYVSGKAERDDFADLSLRTALGGGYGHQFSDSERYKFATEIGLNYINEYYNNSPNESFPALTLGLKYDRKFFDDKLVFFENLTIDASLKDTSDTLVRNRVGIRVPIAGGVTLSTQFNVDYDNQPAPGKKKADTALVFSVGYGF